MTKTTPKKLDKPPEFETYVINTKDLFKRLISYEENTKINTIVIDVEADSLIESKANLYGLGLCLTEKKAFYIQWRDVVGNVIWSPDEQAEIKQWLLTILKKRKLIGHNLVYDVLVLEKFLNFDLTPHIYSDTILEKHTLDEEIPFELKKIGVRELGDWADTAQDQVRESVLKNGGIWKQSKKDIHLADADILGHYCCVDCIVTLMLHNIFMERLKEEGLEQFFFEEEVMPLYKLVTIPMKRRGFNIDLQHFKNLHQNISAEIDSLNNSIMSSISNYVTSFEESLLNKDYPVKNKGKFPIYLAQVKKVPLPTSTNKKTGNVKVTLAKTAIIKMKNSYPQHSKFYDWLLGTQAVDAIPAQITDAQRRMFFDAPKNSGKQFIFNINSGDHIAFLLFKCLSIRPTKFTKGGKSGAIKPATDSEVLDELIEEYKDSESWLEQLALYRKLYKLKSTYVEGILNRQVGGIIYTSLLQHGTISGRYASRNPNLNNLPALVDPLTLIGKYTNAIRKGLVAPPGYKVVGADFASLEPRLAAYVSQDPTLIDIFTTGKDFYSVIGIKQFKKTDATPYNDGSPDSFPVKYKELRKTVKTYALAAFYGITEGQVARTLKISTAGAKALLYGYFKEFPMVKKLIQRSHYEAKNYGYVKTSLGRVRHLNKARNIHLLYGDDLLDYSWCATRGDKYKKLRSEYKKLLNNSINFKIQGLAAHCLNRAMIKIAKKFKELNLDAQIVLPVHDEILVISKESIAQQVADIMEECMGTCVDLGEIKLKSSPIVGNSYGDCK